MRNIGKLPVFLPACFLLFGVPTFLTVIGITFVIWLFLKACQMQRTKRKETELYMPFIPPVRPKTEHDLLLEAFGLIQNRISNYLKALYPEARWIWGTPNALKSISEGREIVIHLKNAGGYHRARVIYHDLQFQSLQFVTYGLPERTKPVSEEKAEPVIKPETDFSLLAFEWINAKLEYLNSLANEAISQDSSIFSIAAEDLPNQDCWQDICDALKDEFHDAEIKDNKITVTIDG